MQVYPRSKKNWAGLWILTAVIIAGLVSLAFGVCWLLRPPERAELITVSGTFSRLETTVTSARYSSHTRYWIYLEDIEGAYFVDDDTGFSKERFHARQGDTVELLCTAKEPPSDVYGIRVNGETVLAYEQAAWGIQFSHRWVFGWCALLGILGWLGWLRKNFYTKKKPSLYRGYRGRRFRR